MPRLRDYDLDIKCIRLRSYVDADGDLFVSPEVIIPLPEARDYIERREAKQKEGGRAVRSSFSLDKGAFDASELRQRISVTLRRR